MAIQVRRGNEVDFDPSKMLPGEWAVSLDTKYVRMCFSPGVCLRMATYEAFEADMEQIKALLAEAESIEEAVAKIQTEINDTAVVVEDYSILSKSYAVGGTGKRENEDSDNAKYYYEQTKQISQGINGIVPMGTVAFANLPTSDIVKNAMYNVSDSFVSDERFNDGGGVSYGPGNNVIWTAEGFWDVTASSSVTGVKGANETVYRQGNVNITAENVGLDNVDNTSDADKPISTAQQAEFDAINGKIGDADFSELGPTLSDAVLAAAEQGSGGDSSVWLSQAEYDALSEEEQNNGTEYQIYDSRIVMKNGVLIGGDFSTADRIKYSDTQNVKKAIDEMKSKTKTVTGTIGAYNANGVFICDYPEGFTKDNCVILSAEYTHTNGQTYPLTWSNIVTSAFSVHSKNESGVILAGSENMPCWGMEFTIVFMRTDI